MHHEEKWLDGWLWCRRSPHGEWEKASEAQMIARMRKALTLVVAAAEVPAHKSDDPAWLHGALLAAKSAALLALGR